MAVSTDYPLDQFFNIDLEFNNRVLGNDRIQLLKLQNSFVSQYGSIENRVSQMKTGISLFAVLAVDEAAKQYFEFLKELDVAAGFACQAVIEGIVDQNVIAEIKQGILFAYSDHDKLVRTTLPNILSKNNSDKKFLTNVVEVYKEGAAENCKIFLNIMEIFANTLGYDAGF